MKSIHYLLAGVVIAGGLTAAAVHAQTAPAADASGPFAQTVQWDGQRGMGGGMGRGGGMGMDGGMSAEERMQRMDRRLSEMKSRLQLTADQEKLWPALESAVREMQKTSTELRDQMRTAMQQQRNDNGQMPDPATRMRNMAAMSTARANGMLKVADALDPLYKTFDDNQKRRFADMSQFAQMGGPGYGGRGRDDDHGYGRGGRDDERGYGRRWRDEDHGHGYGYGRRWRDEERGEYRGRGRDYDDRGYGRGWRDEDRGYGRRWRDDERGYDRYERRRDWQ